MRILVSIGFVLLIFGNQVNAQDAANIEVVKFTWKMFVPNKETDAAVQFDPRTVRQPEQISTGSLPRPERTAKAGEKTIEERSRDLMTVERAARKSGSPTPENIFIYELKVKNTDSKTIKSFVWEYQSGAETPSQNISNRRFLCVEKIKADGSKTLRIFSQLPPVNVLDASAPKNKSDKNYALDIVINRIEYADGTVWKRTDWDDGMFLLESPQITEKLKNNDCAVL